MEADFNVDGATISLEPSEYSFVFRCLNDRLATLADWEIEARLGIDARSANALVDSLLRAESAARKRGNHWLPPKAGAE